MNVNYDKNERIECECVHGEHFHLVLDMSMDKDWNENGIIDKKYSHANPSSSSALAMQQIKGISKTQYYLPLDVNGVLLDHVYCTRSREKVKRHKVEPSISVKINKCSYLETIFSLNKIT
jgi:hypothetical protein